MAISLPHLAWAQDTESTPVIEKEETTVVPQRLPWSEPRHSAPASITQRLKPLGNNYSEKAARWISAGDDTFLAIWQADRSGEGKGALLIVHAEGEHPAWPETTKPLHDTLPDYGWATLAISLPTANPKLAPKRTFPVKAVLVAPETTEIQEKTDNKGDTEENQDTTPATNSPATTTQVTSLSPEKIAEERLTAALKFLHDRGQFNVAMIGSGIGAIRAHAFVKNITPQVTDKRLKEQLEKPVRAFIVYNARNRLPTSEGSYNDWFFDPEIPFLDIFTTVDRRNYKDSQERKILSKQKKAIVYKHVKMNIMHSEVAWGENRLSRRIRSFLDAHARGIEVENARVRRN